MRGMESTRVSQLSDLMHLQTLPNASSARTLGFFVGALTGQLLLELMV